jgi:hypothetical protein
MSNTFQASVDPNAQAALDEARSGGDGKFPPLPRGEYRATVVPIKKDGSVRVEPGKYAKTGPNAGKDVVRVAVKINDDSPTGKGRIFFIRVPLFSRFAPNEKNPQGAPARMYFDFWGALGVSDEALTSGNLGIGPDQMMGKGINIVLGDPQVPDSYNPLGFNEVAFVNKPGPANTPTRQPGVPVAAWLDADDNLIESAIPGQQPDAPAAPPVDPWSKPQAAAEESQEGVVPGPWAQAASY